MHIVSVSAEMVPWSKTGGLGDVCGVLPEFLAQRGHQVMTVAPLYEYYDDVEDLGVSQWIHGHQLRFFYKRHGSVDAVFIEHPAITRGHIYGNAQGGFGDNWFRFSLLVQGALLAAMHLSFRGEEPFAKSDELIFVGHDWHAGLLSCYLKLAQQFSLLPSAKVATVIHNLAHQGVYPFELFSQLHLPTDCIAHLDMDGRMNFLKSAIVLSDAIITVSPSYAEEICTSDYGMGLDSLLRWRKQHLHGVLNGIDTEEYNPSIDPTIAANYSVEDLSGKALCKAHLQRKLGLAVNPKIPIFGFVSRLDAQKGLDLLQEVMPWLLHQGVQVVLLGTGAPKLEQWVQKVGQHANVAGLVTFSAQLAKEITAGSDFLLMPSRFEPCGLSQQHALEYGTLPIVHATGGLKDTVQSFNPWKEEGNGWAFAPYQATALQQALQYAIHTFKHHPEAIEAMQIRGMKEDRRWTQAAQSYESIFASCFDG